MKSFHRCFASLSFGESFLVIFNGFFFSFSHFIFDSSHLHSLMRDCVLCYFAEAILFLEKYLRRILKTFCLKSDSLRQKTLALFVSFAQFSVFIFSLFCFNFYLRFAFDVVMECLLSSSLAAASSMRTGVCVRVSLAKRLRLKWCKVKWKMTKTVNWTALGRPNRVG